MDALILATVMLAAFAWTVRRHRKQLEQARDRLDHPNNVVRGPWQPRAVESQARDNCRPHGSGLLAVAPRDVPVVPVAPTDNPEFWPDPTRGRVA